MLASGPVAGANELSIGRHPNSISGCQRPLAIGGIVGVDCSRGRPAPAPLIGRRRRRRRASHLRNPAARRIELSAAASDRAPAINQLQVAANKQIEWPRATSGWKRGPLNQRQPN